MRRATRSTLEVWSGTGLVVIAVVLLRYLGVTVVSTVAFVVVVLAATVLIVGSIRHSSHDDEP